jgi:hypothetical protein
MTFTDYQQLFQDILSNPNPAAPYDNPAYFDYTKLNWTRQQRWLKTGVLDPVLEQKIKAISVPQTWIVITEPWCGDASHIVPFFHMLSSLNPLIRIDYQLRDSEPFLINSYLTHGSKSIPKLAIRDEAGNDLAVWGPRPAACQVVYDTLKKENADFEAIKTALQKWYNDDKGRSLQQELLELLSM